MLFLVKRRNHAISDLETLKIPSFYVKCCVISNGFEPFLNAFERERCFYAIGFERYFLIRTLSLRNCALFYALCFLLFFIFCDFPRKSSLKSFELFRKFCVYLRLEIYPKKYKNRSERLKVL